MEGMFTFVGIIIIVFGVLQIISFFKMWGMTNNICEIKEMMELSMRKETQEKDKTQKKESLANKADRHYKTSNTELETENFPKNVKFKLGDIVLYKPENTKLIVMDYISPNIFKCKTLDGKATYCFEEDYLDESN